MTNLASRSDITFVVTPAGV